MARKASRRPRGTRVSHHIGLEVLTATVLAELVDAGLADTRLQCQPPARVVVRNRRPARRRNLVTVAGKPETLQS
jgi:hypothetical protein